MSRRAWLERVRLASVLWLGGCLALLAAVTVVLVMVRRNVLAEFSGDDRRRDWQEWREKAAREGVGGPVLRQAPRTDEPPILILMRDHYAVVLGMSLLLASAFYVFFMLLARGMARQRREAGRVGQAAQQRRPTV